MRDGKESSAAWLQIDDVFAVDAVLQARLDVGGGVLRRLGRHLNAVLEARSNRLDSSSSNDLPALIAALDPRRRHCHPRLRDARRLEELRLPRDRRRRDRRRRRLRARRPRRAPVPVLRRPRGRLASPSAKAPWRPSSRRNDPRPGPHRHRHRARDCVRAGLGRRRRHPRRGRRLGRDDRCRARHVPQRPPQGVHRRAQRRLHDAAARREGRRLADRARELRPGVQLLPRRRGGVQRRPSRRRGRRQRARRRGRRAACVRGDPGGRARRSRL